MADLPDATRARPLLKICGLSTPDAIDWAIAAGAGQIGLVHFPPSPRHLALGALPALAASARGRAEIVLLLVDPTDDVLDAAVAAAGPDWVQLHGRETPGRAAAVARRTGLPVMKAIGISAAADVAKARPYAADRGDGRPVAERLLFDAEPPRDATRPGGLGRPFDWALLSGLDLPVPFFLGGGLNAGNVAEAVRVARPFGVDVSSGVESAPGVKDEALIRAFASAAWD